MNELQVALPVAGDVNGTLGIVEDDDGRKEGNRWSGYGASKRQGTAC